MISFKVSAPGKVILFGEHAVVYGKTAIAASLDLRTNLKFKELFETEDSIKLNFSNLNLLVNIPIQHIKECISVYRSLQLKNNGNNFNLTLNSTILNHIQQLVRNIGYNSLQQKSSLEAFYYLFVYISEKEEINIKPVEINLSTEMSIGAGLGSSASFAVCLSACFLHWSRLQKNISKSFDIDDLKLISGYAFECEKLLHGTPSGIDNSICTYGSIIEFRKDNCIRPIPNARKMKILLVDTRVQRSTKAQVEKSANLKRAYPNVIDPIMDAIDNISKEALQIFKKDTSQTYDNGSGVYKEYEEYNKLMTLININQNLLAALQASHPSLDRICAEAQNYAFGAKLTGAGGGGYSFILLPPDTQPETISSISRKLIADGYYVTLTSLGGVGVRIDE